MAQKWSTRAAGNTVTAIPAGAKIPLLTGVPDNEWITAEDAAADSVFSALYQASDATLTSLSALGTAADRFAYTTGVDVWAEATVTAFARTMLDDANAAAVRGTIGLSVSDAAVFAGLTVNGNITVTGTVDGIDVAVLRSDHDTHVANASNPHSVTPAQLGLVIGMNVQAYSANLDAVAASPLTAITAASTYETIANVAAHTGNTGNPHGVTASQVGLGSVENTALSTWAGSANITALGTITTGSIPWARLTDVATQSPTFAGLTVTGMLAPSTVTVALDSGNSQTWVTAIENYGGDCTIIVSGLVTGSAASCGILVQEGTTGLSSDILTHDGVELQFRIITDDLQVASISPGLEGASVKVTALKLG